MEYPEPVGIWSSRPPKKPFVPGFGLGLFFFAILALCVLGVFIYLSFFFQSSLGRLPF